MKKLLAILFCVVMLLSLLAGCDDNAQPTEPSENVTKPSQNITEPSEPEIQVTPIADLLKMQLSDGEVTTERFYIRAKVDKVDNATYGAMTVSDESGTIYVYNSKNADGTVGYANMDDKPYVGDTLVIYGTLKGYQGTIEIAEGYIVSFEHAKVEVDESDYTAMSVLEARSVAKGTKVKVSGVVAKITYSNGMIPSGVVLVDGTSSIYVYDSDLAARVREGNKITILASKTYWILETEQNNAEKFGYAGCNQLETVTLLDNDNKTDNAFDTSWIVESTVKDIVDTPVYTDISTLIFKVTAQIKEVPGSGFTNFYINDLDGTTGSYAYSQCNGSDFAWLREFDGKICTVYLMAINAKSTSSDCFWRFLPVKVVEEGFDPASVDAAKLAVQYVGLPQFQTSYSGNPAMDLIGSADFDLLNVKNVKLSYASSDSSVISVSNGVMSCLKTGTADITVTAEYNGKTYSEKVTIQVSIVEQEVTYSTIKDVIATQVGETVTVQGIVGPSLVNRVGFYLFNGDSMIAVVVNDAAILETLEIGHEVVLEGKRDLFHNGEGDHAGQIAITNATVVTNYYGKHDYSTDFFITDKTLADIVGLNITEQHSTEVYVVKATVEFVETAYYTTLNITDNGVTLKLYMSGANQYNWLKAFSGQEVTMEIAPCNWNNKKDEWRGCVLAVRLEDGSKIVNELNFNN